MDKTFSYKQALFLVKEGIINRNTGIIINGLSKNDSDEFCIHGIYDNKDSVKFLVLDSGKRLLVKQSAVKLVDGMSPIKLYEAYKNIENVIRINVKTNVEEEIIGKPSAKLNGKELQNGDKIILENNSNKKYNDKIWIVKGVGEKIQLLSNKGRPKGIL